MGASEVGAGLVNISAINKLNVIFVETGDQVDDGSRKRVRKYFINGKRNIFVPYFGYASFLYRIRFILIVERCAVVPEEKLGHKKCYFCTVPHIQRVAWEFPIGKGVADWVLPRSSSQLFSTFSLGSSLPPQIAFRRKSHSCTTVG